MTSDLKLTLAQLRLEMEEYLNLDSNDTFAKIEQGYDSRSFGACIKIRKSYQNVQLLIERTEIFFLNKIYFLNILPFFGKNQYFAIF